MSSSILIVVLTLIVLPVAVFVAFAAGIYTGLTIAERYRRGELDLG